MQARAHAEKDGEYFDISHKLLGCFWLPWLSHSRSCVSARLRNAYYQNEASMANLQPIGRLEAKAGVVSSILLLKDLAAATTMTLSWLNHVNPSRLLVFRMLSLIAVVAQTVRMF